MGAALVKYGTNLAPKALQYFTQAVRGAAPKVAQTAAKPSLARMAGQALLTPGGLVTAGLGGLGLVSGYQGLRKAEQNRILEEGKVDGEFDTGIYSALLGLNDDARLDKLYTDRRMSALRDDAGISQLTSIRHGRSGLYFRSR